LWAGSKRGGTSIAWVQAWTILADQQNDRSVVGGFIAADPYSPDPGTVWVTTYNPKVANAYHVWRLTNCNSISGCDAITASLSPFANPGPVAISPNGNVYVSTFASTGTAGALYRYGRAGGTWTPVLS